LQKCAVQENIYTLPTGGLEFPGGWGDSEGSTRLKNWSLIRNFQRGGEVLKKFLLWGRYRYFLEPQ